MAQLFSLGFAPVWIAAAWMIAGAIVDGWKLKVPNRLTFPMILTGWAYWAFQPGYTPLLLSIAGAFAAGALLIVPYAIGGMGAGDVKLYAGFGAWMVPLPWFGFQQLLWAFGVSVVLGAAMAVAMIVWRRSYFANVENLREIIGDWQNSSSVGEVFDKAAARKPRLMLLPYGVPLTIGSLAYIVVLVWSATNA